MSENKRLLKNKYLPKKPEKGGKPLNDNKVIIKINPKNFDIIKTMNVKIIAMAKNLKPSLCILGKIEFNMLLSLIIFY